MNDDFLARVHQVLSEASTWYPDRGIKGAVIGTLLRARGLDPSAHGFEKIRDLMAALEAVGKVKTGSDGKLAYTVWVIDHHELDGKSMPSLPSKTAGSRSKTAMFEEGEAVSEGNRSLRQQVYDAFVSQRLEMPRRFGRASGALWIGNVPQPAPDSDWIDVSPIAAIEQQGWGLRFLVQRGWESEPALVDALRSDDWYRSFPTLLASIHGEAARADWNRRRTARVVRVVEDWAMTHGVRGDLIFEFGPQQVNSPSSRDARTRILALLARLPTAELMKLPIPARFFVTSQIRGDEEGRQ